MDFLNEVKCIVEEIIEINHGKKKIDIDVPLTGDKVGADAVDFVYIVTELMEKYGISFQGEDFGNYKFNTIREISIIVEKRVKGDKQ